MDGKLGEPGQSDRRWAEGEAKGYNSWAGWRWFLTIAGTISVALGLLGIFLPLLPTTPFLLLAAACYLRSSPRLYRWLLTNRWTGEYLSNYRDGRGMPLRGKVVALGLTLATLLASAYLVPDPLAWLVLGSVGLAVFWFVLSMPTLDQERKGSCDRTPS